MQTVLSHPCTLPTAGQEAITSLYTCRATCLLTFDLYLAIEWHCFRCYSPSFPTLATLYKRKLPNGFCTCSSVQVSLVFSTISLLCPDIKSWLVGPDCYYRLNYSRMSTDIFAFRCEKRGIYRDRINYERVVRYTFRKKGEISISKQLLEQFFAVSLVALVIFFSSWVHINCT